MLLLEASVRQRYQQLKVAIKMSKLKFQHRHMKDLFTGVIQGLFSGVELDNKWITEKNQQ